MSTTEAADTALLLRAGSLAAPMEIIEERTIGPTLGAENISKGFASVGYGFAAIAVFMCAYYLLFGVFSTLALAFNLLLLVAVLSMLQATLTLPGMAAIALTLGMAIDANVLINERVREELRGGASPQAAINTGYEKAFATILDSNITTLIAGLALLTFGSGFVKGFAVVHCLGILTSMFSAVMFSRGLVNLWYGGKKRLKSCVHRPGVAARRAARRPWSWTTSRPPRPERAGATTWNFSASAATSRSCGMRWCSTSSPSSPSRWRCSSCSRRGLHLSIEFTGGTVLEVEYAQAADLEKTRAAVEAMGFGEVQVQNFGTSRDVLVRLPVRANTKQSEVAGQVFDKLCAAEGGQVSTQSFTTPQGEQGSRPVCGVAGGVEPREAVAHRICRPGRGQ